MTLCVWAHTQLLIVLLYDYVLIMFLLSFTERMYVNFTKCTRVHPAASCLQLSCYPAANCCVMLPCCQQLCNSCCAAASYCVTPVALMPAIM
jgi:hypothetical protein